MSLKINCNSIPKHHGRDLLYHRLLYEHSSPLAYDAVLLDTEVSIKSSCTIGILKIKTSSSETSVALHKAT